MYKVKCSDPFHEERRELPGWCESLGYSTVDGVLGADCGACAGAKLHDSHLAEDDAYFEFQGDTVRIRIVRRYITGEGVGQKEYFLNLKDALSPRMAKRLTKIKTALLERAKKGKR